MIQKLTTATGCNSQFSGRLKIMYGGILLLLFTTLAFTNCRQVEYIPLQSSHSSIDVSLRYDSISRDHIRYQEVKGDSVHTIDSVAVNHYIILKDTVVTVDSIPTPVPVPVPGEMTERQRFLYDSGKIAWIVVAIGVLALLIYIIIKAIKR